MNALQDPEHEAQKKELRKMLQRRYDLVRNFVNTHKSSKLQALPFNSGYFMSFHVSGMKCLRVRYDI